MRFQITIPLFLRACFALAVATFTQPITAQQAYPSRPVKIVSYVPAGSAADAVMRAVAQEMSRNMGANFVIENKPGASGAVSATAVKSSPPDGHTILVSGSSFMLSTMLRRETEGAFAGLTPISLVVMTPMVLVAHSDLGVKTLDAFVQLAKTKPGVLSYASTGVGSIAHVYGDLFSRRANMRWLHVPYQTVTSSVADVVGGRIDALFSLVGTVQPHVMSGRLIALGITGEKRARAAPNLPTFVESGYSDMNVSAWNGVFAPAGTPPAIVEKLSAEFAKASKTPRVVELATSLGLESTSLTPQEFAAYITRDYSYWMRILEETGIISGK